MANKSYHYLYNTARWKQIREDHLASSPLCVMCLEEGKTRVGTICDHVHNHKGDVFEFFNGERQTLCKSHHDSVKQSQDRTGKRKGFNDLGEPLDKNHPWNVAERKENMGQIG